MVSLSNNANKLLTEFTPAVARRVRAAELEPEHVFLALLEQKMGHGFELLEKLPIDLAQLHIMLEKTIVRSNQASPEDLNPSLTLQMTLNFAAGEARLLQQDFIGTAHLVLGFAHDKNGILHQMLTEAGINLEDVRLTASQILNVTKVDQRSDPQEKAQKVLKEYSTDLTEMAEKGLLDPVIGREKEIERVIHILSRRSKNNPVLIGEAGVGKTSIVEGLAIRIVEEKVPYSLINKKVYSLDLGMIVAGTKYRGQFEERIKYLVEEVAKSKNIILFIDELHTLIGAGSTSGTLDAANMLKPALARSQIQCIGATTAEEYRKYFEKDAALDRRFQTVRINEPSLHETYQILQGLKPKYEQFHHVRYSDDALQKIISLADRYISGKSFPDKAIDIMDEAGAMKKIESAHYPDDLQRIEKDIHALQEKKARMIKMQNFEGAAVIRDEVRVLKKELLVLKEKWLLHEDDPYLDISLNDVYDTVSIMTDIPISSLSEDELARLARMEDELHTMVVGQDKAITTISHAIRRSKAGVSNPNRPIGSFLFLGPTGVGKTLLAKSLAEFLFGSASALIRIDMSDYMEKHNLARLVGSPPGYVGHENGGFLTEKIRQQPYAVILLDEVEKAHPDVFNLLLQVLEEGELTDPLGHVVNFRNTIIIMTSNAGSRAISIDGKIGFTEKTEDLIDYSEIKANAEEEIKRFFSPEILNRIDETIVFSPLTHSELEAIFFIELKELQDRVSQRGISLHVSEAAKEFCIEKGYDPVYGARPLRRILQQNVEDLLAMRIVDGSLKDGSRATLQLKNGKLALSVRKEAKRICEKAEACLC